MKRPEKITLEGEGVKVAVDVVAKVVAINETLFLTIDQARAVADYLGSALDEFGVGEEGADD